MHLVRSTVLLFYLPLVLLTEEHREPLAKGVAPTGEAPAGNRFVEKLCIPFRDAYWDLNCHTRKVHRLPRLRKVSPPDRPRSAGVATGDANMSS